MKKWLIGVDIGGTKIAVTLGTLQGKVLAKTILPSRSGKNPKRSTHEIRDAVLALLARRKIRKSQLIGVGLAVAGAIDAEKGIVLKSPNLPKWQKYPLRASLSRMLRLPVFIENDANAAALGERYFGLGKGADDFLYVTISTGVGSGIIANGQLIRGESGSAGELGHITIAKHGNRCKCGKRGCLEAYASGTAIGNSVRRKLANGSRSRYFSAFPARTITGSVVSAGANKGDRVAIRAREEAADAMGIGLANVINLLNPKRIILGGGVMENVRYYWSPMMAAVRREAWASSRKHCCVVRSKLGKRVGDLGAMAVILDGVKK